MKLVNYRCPSCGQDHELLYNDTDEVPNCVLHPCEECDHPGLEKWNLKDNGQCWFYADAE